MASAGRKGRNEPKPRPIIVKKVVQETEHGPHHGGAWKIAYADFVTAMMAFFLLMWLLGSTDEQKRKGLADYFTPTLIEYKQNSAGSNGILGGDSIVAAENYPHRATQTGSRSIVIPKDASGGVQEMESSPSSEDRERFERLKRQLIARIEARPDLRRLLSHVRFSESREGLRIDLVDEADFSMFRIGTDELVPEAARLIREVAEVIAGVPNEVIIRGHTDGLPYAAGGPMNNWRLSSGRAETTRATLHGAGIVYERFARIEGVADREPFIAQDHFDPRNRRMSITLAWRKAAVIARSPAEPDPARSPS